MVGTMLIGNRGEAEQFACREVDLTIFACFVTGAKEVVVLRQARLRSITKTCVFASAGGALESGKLCLDPMPNKLVTLQ